MPDRLILCLDGTWNSTFHQVERDDKTKVLKASNPLKLARAVLPVDQAGNRQVTYYDSGVGALGLYPGMSNRLLNFADSKLGGAWGAGFEAKVEEAANFLANNWKPEMQIYLFGYSRGAAQARALTNFLSWMGGFTLKNDAYFVPLFFRHYIVTRGEGSPHDVKTEGTGDSPAERLVPITINFLGVWDTVMALGSRFRASTNNSTEDRSFHVGPLPATCVEHARQALAIDEERYDFRPQIWEGKHLHQSLAQRWYPGSHGNVGGAYGNDGLANAALHWILGEAEKLGLATDSQYLSNFRDYPQDKMGESYTGIYPTLERIRGKFGKGARPLRLDLSGAYLSVAPSVITRLCSDPAKHNRMVKRYRPKALIDFVLEKKADWPTYVASLGLNHKTHSFPDDI